MNEREPEMNAIAMPALHQFRIAQDTFAISLENAIPNVGFVYVNSMVIRGPQPIVVDTGMAVLRDQWLDQIFSIVEPEDVRWIFLSHDDADHSGNVVEMLELCRHAQLVTNWFSIERMSANFEVPLDRCIWVNDGEQFLAGDRMMTAIRPPIFDSPTTRGLFDPKTGVYWAGDAFCSFVPFSTEDVADVPLLAFREGFSAANRMISPWHQWIDPKRYEQQVQKVARLPLQVVYGGHGPAIRGRMIDRSLDLIRELPST